MIQKTRRNFRVVVLAGGVSAERRVSLRSGASVAQALRQAGHQTLLVDPLDVEFDHIDWQRFHGCFLSLHGGAGEDGRIQRQLAERGVRFTGSDAAASRAAMSKSTAKACFQRAGVPTPKHVLIPGPLAKDPLKKSVSGVGRAKLPLSRGVTHGSAGASPSQLQQSKIPTKQIAAAIEHLGYPLVIKPDSQGSSLGVGLARGAGELAALLPLSSRFGWPLLAEQYIAGREFTVTVLGRRPLQPLEITGCGGIFDYASKYSGKASEYHTPGDLRPITLEKLQSAALGAAAALGTAGMVRVDLILDRGGRAWVLEVNTLPGMTPESLAPRAARQIGWEMADLCDWMLRDAVG